jgi:hypothetical protein
MRSRTRLGATHLQGEPPVGGAVFVLLLRAWRACVLLLLRVSVSQQNVRATERKITAVCDSS